MSSPIANSAVSVAPPLTLSNRLPENFTHGSRSAVRSPANLSRGNRGNGGRPGLGDPGLGNDGLGSAGIGSPGIGNGGSGNGGIGNPGIGNSGLGNFGGRTSAAGRLSSVAAAVSGRERIIPASGRPNRFGGQHQMGAIRTGQSPDGVGGRNFSRPQTVGAAISSARANQAGRPPAAVTAGRSPGPAPMNWNGRSSIGQERGVARLIDAAAGARAPLPLSRFSDDALAGFFAGAGRTLEHLPLREIIASGIEALRCSLAIAEPSGQSAVMQGPMPLAAFAQTRPATQFESKLTRLAKTLSPYFFDERPLPYERGSSTRTAQERKPDQAGTSLFQMLSSLFRLMRDLFLGR